jgi:hypothetical protein
VQVFKQQARLFKSALLAGGLNAYQHLFNGKDARKSVHIEGGLCTFVVGAIEELPKWRPEIKTAPLGAV